MKRVYILVLCFFGFFIGAQKSYSQPVKAISENAIWITRFVIGAPGGQSWTYYRTGGDTLLGGKNYIKLFKMALQQTGSDTYNATSNLEYLCAFRNDSSHRAFIYPKNDSTEHLWYDMNLEIGDTVPTNNPWYSTSFLIPNDSIVVTGIDSVLYCNDFHKRFKFTHFNPWPGQFPDLIEGIGFTGDLYDYNWPYFEGYAFLDFFTDDTSMIDCSVTITNVSAQTTPDEWVHVYPNPSMGIINIEFPNDIKPASRISVKDITGKCVFVYDNSAFAKRLQIDARLESGFYLLFFEGAESQWIQKIQYFAP